MRPHVFIGGKRIYDLEQFNKNNVVAIGLGKQSSAWTKTS